MEAEHIFFKSLLSLGKRGGVPAAWLCELAPWDRCCCPRARWVLVTPAESWCVLWSRLSHHAQGSGATRGWAAGGSEARFVCSRASAPSVPWAPGAGRSWEGLVLLCGGHSEHRAKSFEKGSTLPSVTGQGQCPPSASWAVGRRRPAVTLLCLLAQLRRGVRGKR